MIEVSATINGDAVLRLIPKDGKRDDNLLENILEGRVLVSQKKQEDGSWALTFRDAGKVSSIEDTSKSK